MQTQEIRHDQWQMFFDDFSRQHQGEPVTLEVLDGENGRQAVAYDQPLLGITDDTKASEGETIEIICGTGTTNINHDIVQPAKVYLARTDDGRDAAIEIESAEGAGPKTILRFGGVEWASQYGA
jgi:hypothetical protein